jgi:hypothetical protein
MRLKKEEKSPAYSSGFGFDLFQSFQSQIYSKTALKGPN